jgi:sulfopyruvate decarboxylase subunit beta
MDAFTRAFTTAMKGNELSCIVAKVEAVGPKGYVTPLALLENRFQFKRHIEGLTAETRRRGESGQK